MPIERAQVESQCDLPDPQMFSRRTLTLAVVPIQVVKAVILAVGFQSREVPKPDESPISEAVRRSVEAETVAAASWVNLGLCFARESVSVAVQVGCRRSREVLAAAAVSFQAAPTENLQPPVC